jgi:hypothetical protein
MTPMLFEALIFLKENKLFWNLELCTKAILMAKSDRVEARINPDTVLDQNLAAAF